jgi:hypothetical protein
MSNISALPSDLKPSEALRLARDNLSSQKRWCFICRTLQDIDTPGALKAQAHIRDLLAPHDTYGMWLLYHDKAWYKKYESTPSARLDARLCWIDDMIEYWESKGE